MRLHNNKAPEVVKRIPSYSNAMMIEDCERMLRVLTQHRVKKIKKKKKVRGVDTVYYEEQRKYMFKQEPKLIDKLHRSIEYYRTCPEPMKESKITLRDYQQKIVEQATSLLTKNKFVYLAMEVRTGKTLTSLSALGEIDNVDNVLFLTKKKAIGSITEDYNKLAPDYEMTIINYESIHKIPDVSWDAVVLDEAHGLSAFPKPSSRAKAVKELMSKHNPYVILLSGTPTPESYSQMYHQVYSLGYNPFREYKNFYRFADDYVDVRQRKVNGLYINDYSRGTDKIMEAMKPYMITYSQKEAGFENEIREHILRVDMPETTMGMVSRLKKDLVIEGKTEVILADTPVKLMQKVHQLCSGTIKFESGKSMVLDTTKAEFIKEKFKEKTIGIFYKFKEELNALKKVFGNDMTTELSVLKDTDCQVIALQIVSGREGITLRDCDALVYYNIDFSATSYWQSRDRMTTKDRKVSDVYWIFSRGGIEDEIYKAVTKKKDYTLSHFKKDFC